MDKLVLDIETANTFADVGGDRNVAALKVSLVGIYSYNRNEYLSFDEHQLDVLAPLLQGAGLIVGFALNRFDLPVLAKHYPFNLMALPRLDLLEEIELASGRRISLGLLAKANLGIDKTATGLDAPVMYREGRMEELRDYCLTDVRITKDLYELAKAQRHLLVPERDSGELVKVDLVFEDEVILATLF